MVQALSPPPRFCNPKTIRRRQNESSCYICFSLSFLRILFLYLLFILWKSVENNQPLFNLTLYCFFPLTLILCTWLNSLYFCSLRLEYQKGYIEIGLTHCIKTFVTAMTIDDMGCVAQAKMVFYRICKNIEFIRIFKKVRLTKVICNTPPVYCSSIYLHPLTICHVLSTVFR